MPDNYKFQPTQRDLTEAVKRQNFQPQEQNKSVVAPPNLFQRLTGAVNGFITGGLWTPGAPNNPIAPGGTPPRQMDYPITFNIDIAPRSGMAIKFEELMALADSSDLTRMVIERRKDQMAKLKWSIQYRDEIRQGRERGRRCTVYPRSTSVPRQRAQFFNVPARHA